MTGQVVALHPSKTIADAAEAFLQRDMAATTRRSYTQTINRLTAEHGTLALGALDGATLDTFTAAAWGQCAPATWNRHVATLRSFTAFARRRGWLTADPASVLERRTEPADRTRAIAAASLERLFRREDVAGPREVPLAPAVRDSRPRAGSPRRRRHGPRPGEQAPTRTAQRWRQRLAALPIRLSAAPAQADRRPRRRADLPRRPAPQPRPRARRAGPVPGHRPWPSLLRTIRLPVQARFAEGRQDRLDAAPATPLRPDAPRRGRRQPAPADGQERPRQSPITPEIRPTQRRSRRRHDRRPRPGPPSTVVAERRTHASGSPTNRSQRPSPVAL